MERPDHDWFSTWIRRSWRVREAGREHGRLHVLHRQRGERSETSSWKARTCTRRPVTGVKRTPRVSNLYWGVGARSQTGDKRVPKPTVVDLVEEVQTNLV